MVKLKLPRAPAVTSGSAPLAASRIAAELPGESQYPSIKCAGHDVQTLAARSHGTARVHAQQLDHVEST
ncbi:uncharacterized protein CIMG_12866 [Coccidioides immitis RS]|uniref:Uncharacterized protein n=1 Tax=Coccidioides immitis (strain RS) TaxID=246410 RepID=A0A0D8JTK9_COCIM|nr:uncharacterized protein CIMG_12866 [Coccidioides immitis RS]KJF60301.1 hypothetical protein CIMG_12866 [Coccidioides immitis RS]